MKKATTLILSVCMILVLFAGCGTDKTAPDKTATETPTPSATTAATAEASTTEKSYTGQILYVANWQGYCSDTNYCEKAFEDKFGCKVEHVYFNSYDELMTTLQTGGNAKIDCCVLSQNYTQYFHDKDLIMNVNPADIPNYAGVDDLYKDVSPYAVDDSGNVFAFPWTTGVTSMVYNPKYVTTDVEHWSDMLNPAFKGHVCLNSDYGDGMIIASLISGQDPSKPDELDLDLVSKTLDQLKPQILSFWSSNDEQLMPYYSGDFWIGDMWSGPHAKLVNDDYAVNYVHPSEGTVGYLDFWTIIEGTDEYDLACEWINWIESYELQYTMATGEDTTYAPPAGQTYPTYVPINAEVLANMTNEQLTAVGMNPQPTKICMLNYLTQEQKDAWLDVWNNFKASVTNAS